MGKEYKKFEKRYNDLFDRMTLANTQTYASSKSQKGIEKKKSSKGKHDDKDGSDLQLLPDGNSCPW